MANKTYSKSTLSYITAQVKRQIINSLKKEHGRKYTKTQIFEMIAKKLELKSARTLWLGDTREYLDDWYNKLEEHILKINQNYKFENSLQTQSSSNTDSFNLQDLSTIIQQKNILIKQYEKALKILRVENEHLRLLVIEKHGKIDI